MDDEFDLENEGLNDESKQLILSLPKEKGWRTKHIYLYQNFWCQPREIQATIAAQKHFKALDDDVIVASIPKSGTTWLKALVFAITKRDIHHDIHPHHDNHPLLNFNPHNLVPFFEYKLYANNQVPQDLSILPSPRLFATHVPYHALPESIKNTKCKIVYICRNPLDTFVSIWNFLGKARPQRLGPLSMEEGFDMYCKGHIGFGPYWDHMLGYWRESQKCPHKVMFLKYEDLKEDGDNRILKTLAKFIGYPFSEQEEKDGVVEGISELCSFQNLRNLEVNKSGKSILQFDNRSLFRKGVVGDWVNVLSDEMVNTLYKVMEEKLAGSGLEFKFTLSS